MKEKLMLSDIITIPQFAFRITVCTQLIYPEIPEKEMYETSMWSDNANIHFARRKQYALKTEAEAGHRAAIEEIQKQGWELVPAKWEFKLIANAEKEKWRAERQKSMVEFLLSIWQQAEEIEGEDNPEGTQWAYVSFNPITEEVLINFQKVAEHLMAIDAEGGETLRQEVDHYKAMLSAIQRILTVKEYRKKRDVQFQMLRDIVDIIDRTDRGQNLIQKELEGKL